MAQLVGPNGLPLSVPPDPDALRKAGFGDSPLPHPLTYAALFNVSWKNYYQRLFDEARRKGFDFAGTMRNDSFLTGLMWERTLAVTSLPWHLEIDDENDPRQCAVRDHLTKQLKRTPGFRGMMKSLQYERTWYGRTAVETNYAWADMPFTLPVLPAAPTQAPGQPPPERDPDGGLPIEDPSQPKQPPVTPAVAPVNQRSLYVKEWFPINGDKIGHMWNGTPTILVNASQTDKIADAEFVYNDLNKALVVSGSWKDHFLFHYAWPEDSDFFDGFEAAEARFGVGVRSKIALWQWIRMEWVAKISDFMDRSIPKKLWYWELGNAASEEAVRLAAKTDSDKTDIILPRSALNKNQGVEYLQASMENVTQLMELVKHIEQEYIIPLVNGQKMSRDHTGSGGLGGSGAADMAGDTKGNITEDDANSLAECLTGGPDVHGLVYFLQRHTFPETLPSRPGGFPVRFCLGYMDPKGKERLETIKLAGEMVPVKAADVYKAAGLTKPTATDELAEKPAPKANPFDKGGEGEKKGKDEEGDDFEPKPEPFQAAEPPAPAAAPPAWNHERYALDQHGHDHAPAGEGGGRFVPKHQHAVASHRQNARKGVAGAKDRKEAVAAIKDAANAVKETMTAHVAEKLGPLLESLKKQHGRTPLASVKKHARAFASAVAVEFRESMAGALANSGSKLDVLDAIEDDPIDWKARLDDLSAEVETEVEDAATTALSADEKRYPDLESEAGAARLDADAKSIARRVAAETRAALADETAPPPAESPLKTASPSSEPEQHAAPPEVRLFYSADGLLEQTRQAYDGAELVTRFERDESGAVVRKVPSIELNRFSEDAQGHQHKGPGPGGGQFTGDGGGKEVEFDRGGRTIRGKVTAAPGGQEIEGMSYVETMAGWGKYIPAEQLRPGVRPIIDLRPEDEKAIELLKDFAPQPHGSRTEGRSGEESDLDLFVTDPDAASAVLEKAGYELDRRPWGVKAIKDGHEIDLMEPKGDQP